MNSADGGIIVPSWGRVIAYAALVSSLLGIALVAVIILANAVFALPLFILMPLSLSWHFSRTYRLPYRCVPKFGWLPWAFALTFAWLMAVVVISWLGLTQSLQFLLHADRTRQISARCCHGISDHWNHVSCDGLCDDVLYSATIEMEAIAVRANVDIAGIISSESGGGVSLAFHSVDRVSWLRPFPVLNGLLAGCALTVAMFYALIQTHPAIRERILMARK